MTTETQEVLDYPFGAATGLELDPRYARVRTAKGLTRVQPPHGEQAWLATRYEDVKAVLGDRRFSRAMGRERDEPRTTEAPRPDGLLSMDAPQHTRLRVLLAQAFTPRRVELQRPAVRAIAEELVGAMKAKGAPAELIEDYALPLPVRVICSMLGVPLEDRERFAVWTNAMVSMTLTADETARHFGEMAGYITGLITRRRAEPADDLMSLLIQARDDGDRLSEQELLILCVQLLVAGHESTSTQIPNFVHVLLERPELLERIAADHSVIPDAVEELMRFVPLNVDAVFARYATEDVEVGGTLVRAGEPVLVEISSANRDAARFADPDEIRFDRPGNQHVGFGHGIHHCLGAQLARLELQETLRAIVVHLPGLRLAGEVEWKSRTLLRGPLKLPVAW
ncbi:cytochrome P450 [Lentzea sp. NBRC 102530]|uniref:cytochrome P450 n=1 Tax=Lentzea sp. NBRC 102530 TaxID=3032201 RepID=UPI0024A540BA|nr:cytochrome P450 [Lentzea sp. NBRC 102530]GLY46850.1 cytochrome P450 [Lentzea sp. NBRC 102530]